MEILVWVIVGIVVVVLIALWVIYNSLVTLKIRVDEAWSDITVQLKRRLDLIPNLVETVKGYAKHEKGVFEEVTKARANALNAQGVKETAAAENQFEGALKSLFAVAEAYPDLKASEEFMQLQAQLRDLENSIENIRRDYNSVVREFNILIESFPSNVIATWFDFRKADFFELEAPDMERKPVKVSFS
jgi:LemA protein